MEEGNWWDPIVNFFTGGSGNSGSGMTGTDNNLGKLADDTSSYTLPTDTGSLISNAADTAAGVATGNLAQDAATSYGNMDKYIPAGLDTSGVSNMGAAAPVVDTTALQQRYGNNGYGAMGDTTAGLNTGAVTNASGNATDARGGYGAYAAPSTTISDLTNGITGGLKKAGSFLEAHPSLVNAGLNLANKSSVQTGVPPAYQQAAAVQTTGNQSAQQVADKKTAVGDSLVNQAPFLANNALSGAMNQNAANEAALTRSLTQQGYKPGDAQYDSALAQHRTSASQNNGTAWAQGQGQMASQEQTGAGLYTAYTPQTSALDKLGDAQYKSQQDTNTNKTDVLADAQNLYNIYTGGDTATKTPTIKNVTDGTQP